jgi:CRISPR-associated protein Cmr2
MTHLFLFSLGPVQSFIAQARKTHDLYAGSKLLSHLVNKAIDIVGEGNLIFPMKGEAMPNRFLAEVPVTETNFQAFGERVEEAVREEWRKISKTALVGIPEKPIGFDEQVNGLLEIFWAIEPLESEDHFKETIALLEKNLAAIKNIRPFEQYTWQENHIGEQGRKCILDGQRNVLFYRQKNGMDRNETGSPLYSTPSSVYISQQFPPGIILQPGEGLSAVSFVKRSYKPGNSPDFESTAEIALMDMLSKLEKSETGDVKTCISLIKRLNAQLFYEENASGDALLKYLREAGITEESANSYEKCSEKVRVAAAKAGLKMMKYYAVLTFDGDDMGKWLSGENLQDQSQLRAFQAAFATCLADFASAAKNRLNKGSGQAVYAGGDDFLGFVNLNHLLPVMKELRILFQEKVDLPLQKFKKNNAKRISFSAGVCVAHYKEPLSLVLQEAKEAQKAAKKLDEDKDAFAISVIKGSGENHIVVLPFGENAEHIEKFQSLTQALVREDFSNNFIKTMRREFERLMDFKNDRNTFEEVFEVELKRLLRRAANNETNKESADTMAEMLMGLFGARNTENFFQMLHIADFFQREMDILKDQSAQITQTI